MRILITLWAFAPRIGGTEWLSEILTDMFTTEGHEVRIVTRTPVSNASDAPPPKACPYEVIRRPVPAVYRALGRWADVNLHASPQLKHLLQTILAGPGPVIQHNYDYAEPGFGSWRGAWAKLLLTRAPRHEPGSERTPAP